MLESILEALKRFTEWVLNLIIDLLVYILNKIPSPDFVDAAVSGIETFADVASYPLYLIAFDVGFPMVVSAVLIKFVIRRLPIVG